MLEKLEAVSSRYEELCAKSEQPDFYADPQKAAKLLREKNDLEPIVAAYTAYNRAQQEMDDAEELMSDPEMKELCQQTYSDAKAEKELKIERWVQIFIEYKEEGKLENVRLFKYDLPRDVYERRKWVIRWRLARIQCKYPKQFVECRYHYYDRRSGESLGFGSCLSRLISSKAQVTKAEMEMWKYIVYNRQHNLFFNEDTDEDLVKFKEKLERKKANVAVCEKRLEELVKRKNNIKN